MSESPESIFQRLSQLDLVGLTLSEARAVVEAAGGRLLPIPLGQRAVAGSMNINGVTVLQDDSGTVTRVLTIGRPHSTRSAP